MEAYDTNPVAAEQAVQEAKGQTRVIGAAVGASVGMVFFVPLLVSLLLLSREKKLNKRLKRSAISGSGYKNYRAELDTSQEHHLRPTPQELMEYEHSRIRLGSELA